MLSHAGLAVRSAGLELLCDPWILGSTYWRSWWNYPPVTERLRQSLRPDYIYLTHIHWDHFQGASLKLFPRETPIIITRDNCPRMRQDLERIGFTRVVELEHGQSMELAEDFRITCYQFDFTPTDSALIIESDGTTMLNANDAKFMHWPLRQIMANHPRIDFVLRSHSSANNRLCYEITDGEDEQVDDITTYISSFAAFAVRVGATYAIPFASNHCYLHRDTYRFNRFAQTPQMVSDYFAEHGIRSPQVKVMVSGDSWSTENGFALGEDDFFSDKEAKIAAYAEEKHAVLEKTYAIESHARVNLQAMEKYFVPLFSATPWFLRWIFRDNPVVYVFHADGQEFSFSVDLWHKRVVALDSVNDHDHPIQIHTSAYIGMRCLAMKMFCHLSISKRVRYRVTRAKKSYLDRFENVLQLYEYGITPLRRIATPYFCKMWLKRWREAAFYCVVVKDILLRREIRESRYI